MATNNAINNSADNLTIENLDFSGSTISTNPSNTNLNLSPAGTGLVSIASAYTLPRVDGSPNFILKTNGSGVVSWAAESAQSFTWNLNTSETAVALAVNNGYIANNSSATVVYTLPSTFAIGDVIEICALAGNGFRINQNSGQFMVVGNSITTIGTSGNIQSQAIGDWVQLLGVSANQTMMVDIKVGNTTIT